MPPSRGDTHSFNRGFIRGCFRVRSLLLSSATPDTKPPHFLVDYFFWAAFLDLAGACGYVAADFMRGYFNAHPDASNILYQVLGVVFVIESACFALSWRQVTYQVGCWPHLSAEYLNILSCIMYLTTACMYGYRGGVQDPQTVAIGYAVVIIELIAAIFFTFDAALYWWVWCVDNLEEAEQQRFGKQLGPPLEGRVCARHMWLCLRRDSCRNVEMQEHLWNVVPCCIYITAALVSVYLQIFIANPPGVIPLPTMNDSVLVPGATCFPNVPYALLAPAAGPPCSNPRLFNAPCPVPQPGGPSICWEALAYPAGSLCASNATEAWCVGSRWWTPAPRNGTIAAANGTRECFRLGSYSPGDPCAAPGLWPGIALPETTCQFIDSLSPATRPPCNDPSLWARAENQTYVVVPRLPPPSIGELDALRYSARVYVVGDTLFALDAAIVLWAWWIYAEDRRREYEEHSRLGGGSIGGSAGSSASVDKLAPPGDFDDSDEDRRARSAAGSPGGAGSDGEGGNASEEDDSRSQYSARSGIRRGRWAALGFAPTGQAKRLGAGNGDSDGASPRPFAGSALASLQPQQPQQQPWAQLVVTGAPGASERMPLLSSVPPSFLLSSSRRTAPPSPLARGASTPTAGTPVSPLVGPRAARDLAADNADHHAQRLVKEISMVDMSEPQPEAT